MYKFRLLVFLKKYSRWPKFKVAFCRRLIAHRSNYQDGGLFDVKCAQSEVFRKRDKGRILFNENPSTLSRFPCRPGWWTFRRERSKKKKGGGGRGLKVRKQPNRSDDVRHHLKTRIRPPRRDRATRVCLHTDDPAGAVGVFETAADVQTTGDSSQSGVPAVAPAAAPARSSTTIAPHGSSTGA